MTYDIKRVRAPRATGRLLRALAAVAESGPGGALLAGKLLAQVGVTAMRRVPAPEAPWPGGCGLPEGSPRATTGARCDPAPAEKLVTLLPEGSFVPETAADFVRAYTEGRTDPEAVAGRVIEATAASDRAAPPLRAMRAQSAEDVLAQARTSAARWRAGRPLSALDGVPVAVKDELDQTPYSTTVGTRFLGNAPADKDATVVRRLREAGALLIGKACMHEIGIGVTGVNPHHGAARNPHDPARMTGGSSSGPAAAVAAGLCPVAIGADGGGSIRIPAGLCGVVGLKPTFGRVSEHGAAPLCWSVAHVGPIGATVRDVALAYALTAGPDARDPGSLRQPTPELAELDRTGLEGLRIGVYPAWFDDADPEVAATCRTALALLEGAGARVVEVEIPELGVLRTAHMVTIVSEMAASHAKYRQDHRTDYGADTRMNLALAERLLATDYIHAQRLRTRLCGHFDRVLEAVDLIATPTTACTAPIIPPESLSDGESDLDRTTRIMLYATAGNLTGLPGVTVPAGYDPAGMPVGFQLMGRPWSESLLLRAAGVVERGVVRRRPHVSFTLL